MTGGKEESFISQNNLTIADEIPTTWSMDLKEGLSVQDISYDDITTSELEHVYSLYNSLSYPSLRWMESIPSFLNHAGRQQMCTCAILPSFPSFYQENR